MKVKALGALRSKLFKASKKSLQILKFRLKKLVFIRKPLRFRSHKTKSHNSLLTKPMSSFLSAFRSPKKNRSIDRLEDLRSPSSNMHESLLFPSPLTPAYIRAGRPDKGKGDLGQDVEDACRSFENYLVEMIVEEGKTKDLMDVEELLYCWKNLKCPAFIDLVCRFYGELCKDLFSAESEEAESSN